MEVNKQENKIGGLGFRELVLSSLETDTESAGILLDSDITDEEELTIFHRWFNSITRKFNPQKNFLAFIIDFLEYLFARLRVLWVLISVFFEIIGDSFESLKDSIVKKMFWGRGSFLKYAVQIATIIVVVILSISYVYRAPSIINANEEELDYISVAEGDTLAMNATLNTAIPKDRERRGIEEYTVMNGDTLSTIAAKYEVSVQTIKWANNLTSDMVKPGQKLEIPLTDGVLVTVKKGDTLSSLAKKYSGNEQAIADFNLLDYPFILSEGQKLVIPEGKMPAPPKPVYAAAPKTYVSGSTSSVRSYSVGVADPSVGKFLGWPVAGKSAKISQNYRGRLHTGIDIADRNLPNILAAADGTVIFAGCSSVCPPLGSTYGGREYAWSIQIDHGNGYTTWYAHLKNIYVRSGQTVKRGQAIGQMGSTGRSTGPHLHFELRKGVRWGTDVNPRLYTTW